MSQDIGMQNTHTDEGRRPAGTEDLLVGHDVDEHERTAHDQDRLDGDRLEGEHPDGDRYDRDPMDARDGTDTRDHVDDEDRLDGERLDTDRLDGDRIDTDRIDTDRIDTDRLDTDRVGGERYDEGRMDGQEHLGTPDRMGGGPMDGGQLDGGQWTDEETTAGGDRIVDQEIDGELGDVSPSGFGQPQAAGYAPPADTTDADGAMPLFARDQVDGFRHRWVELQAAFVDDPRTAVQQADQLVAEVMQSLAATFASNKQDLEGQWQREGTADTEDLRQALRRYRSFFDQLLRN